MKKILGRRGRLIAGVMLTTIGAVILMGFLSVKMLEWSLLYRKGAEAEIIAASVQAIVRDGKGYETNAFKGFVARVVEKGVIQDLSVIDSSGRPSFVTGKGLVGNRDHGKDLYFIGGLDIKMTGIGWFEGVGREFLVSAPLSGAGGTVMFSMPLVDIRAEIGNFKRFVYFYAIFDSAVIIAFGMYLFSRGIMRPLKLLRETAEAIARGDLSQRADTKEDNDIGGLARSFNIMADRLEERIRALEMLNQALRQELMAVKKEIVTVGKDSANRKEN